ncbi:MAG: hypothetical protein WAR37_02485 [Candidatus Microsaccharimonas sp.]
MTITTQSFETARYDSDLSLASKVNYIDEPVMNKIAEGDITAQEFGTKQPTNPKANDEIFMHYASALALGDIFPQDSTPYVQTQPGETQDNSNSEPTLPAPTEQGNTYDGLDSHEESVNTHNPLFNEEGSGVFAAEEGDPDQMSTSSERDSHKLFGSEDLF